MKTTIFAIAALLTCSAAFASLDDMPTRTKPTPKPAIEVKPIAPSGAPEKEQIKPIEACDYDGLTVSLTIDRAVYRSGEIIAPTITFKCSWEPRTLFNPFLDQRTFACADVRVFDDSGKLVAHYLDNFDRAIRLPAADDYVLVRAGGFVGTQASLYLVSDQYNPHPLENGHYRMQVVAFDTLIRKDAGTRDYGKDPPKVIAASPLAPFMVGSK
jgi:hypothetical protein